MNTFAKSFRPISICAEAGLHCYSFWLFLTLMVYWSDTISGTFKIIKYCLHLISICNIWSFYVNNTKKNDFCQLDFYLCKPNSLDYVGWQWEMLFVRQSEFKKWRKREGVIKRMPINTPSSQMECVFWLKEFGSMRADLFLFSRHCHVFIEKQESYGTHW